ncbi:MAG: DoxX family membrane protein [Alphaproteobacteria bacterium]|nr:DoxX family membrane protein [Alphaproteobacteria bacterium]
METFIATWTPRLLSVLRIMSGLLFMEHGTAKLLHFPQAQGPTELPPLLLVAGVLELAGGALVATGLFTRIVAFVLSGEMAIAYFMAHAPNSFFPLVNHGEGAILYCFIFLYLAFAGGGEWSLDRALRPNAKI